MKNDPIIFAKNVMIGLSTTNDGDMRTIGKIGAELKRVREDRVRFLNTIDLTPDNTVLVMADYDSKDFCRYYVIDDTWRGRGMMPDHDRPDVSVDAPANDALATTSRNLGLFLPLADCLGAVIYDPKNHALMVSHLGRHSTEQFGAQKSIEFMTQNFGTNPRDVQIWLSPAAGCENYPLYAFDNKSLHVVNTEQFVKAGVLAKNIIGENIDTTTDENYFSHSSGDTCQRFAIVAKLI